MFKYSKEDFYHIELIDNPNYRLLNSTNMESYWYIICMSFLDKPQYRLEKHKTHIHAKWFLNGFRDFKQWEKMEIKMNIRESHNDGSTQKQINSLP